MSYEQKVPTEHSGWDRGRVREKVFSPEWGRHTVSYGEVSLAESYKINDSALGLGDGGGDLVQAEGTEFVESGRAGLCMTL